MGVKMEGNNPNEVTFVVSRNKKPWYENDLRSSQLALQTVKAKL
jgi:hypothetical protein